MPKESAVEILVFKPNPILLPDQRGVHENLWIKQRFKQYVSIGVYLDGSDLKYYFFENCDNSPKIYSSLVALKQDLPSGLEDIFGNTPKLFVMGHGRGDCYGLGNHPVEICGTDFDKVVTDFEDALPEQHDDIFVTLEACNTDNCEQAARGNQEKTFLARLSETHQDMTFCGTGPWDPKDPQTGYRASGGFPTLNVPITAMGGGIWKHGNSVIFFHDDYQIVVRKSLFASTATAKELKINTIKYACEILEMTSLDADKREGIIISICANRDVLKIEDLKCVPGFPQGEFNDQAITKLLEQEKQILEKEKNNYIRRVQKILARTESGGKFTERDVLIIALGLKHVSVFEGHEDVRDKVLGNKALLQLVMVTCGKVLIAGPSNDGLIDYLLERGININSADEKGMTALHYAAQNFYNYRKEPLNLIEKLLDCGANIEVRDIYRRTPLMILKGRSKDQRASARENVQQLLEQRLLEQSLLKPAITSGRNANCFFQSFIHVFTRLPDKIHLQLLQDSTYRLPLHHLVENFNLIYAKLLPNALNLKEIIELSKSFHPLDRELIFGPVLRITYNALVEANLIQTEPLGLGEHDIVLAHQTVAFANCFGACLSVYMPEEELSKARIGGMPSDVESRIQQHKVEVGGEIFFCDRQAEQPMIWALNLVFAGVHLNYTLGSPELNQCERDQVVIGPSNHGGCIAYKPADIRGAPLFSAHTEEILSFRMAKIFCQKSASSGMVPLLLSNASLFRKFEDKFLEEHRYDDPRLQREYDKRFGLVPKP